MQMTDEQNVMRRVMLAIGGLKNVRLFRNNTGQGYVGEKVSDKTDKDGNRWILLKNPRPLHAGLTLGSSDLIGFTAVTITPEMVGRKFAIFTALEIKTKTGRASKEQQNFINIVQNFGGLAGIVRTESEAAAVVQYEKE